MDALLKQGLKLIARQRYQPAHQLAIELIGRNPKDSIPYFLLARLAFDHQNLTKAAELFVRATELEPDNPLYLASYGQYLVSVGRQLPALDCAKQVASRPIDDAFVADIVGVIYSRTGFHEKAVPFFENAVRLNPAPANFHYNLGASLQFSGQFERAEAAYRQTIDKEPTAYRAYSSLVGLSRQTSDNNLLEPMQALFAEHEQDPEATLHLGHAIAKTLEDLDQPSESFDWLVQAKRLKRKTLNYSAQTDLRLFQAAKHTVAGSCSTRKHCSDAAPIFIIGLPRTGTTLVDRILSSHPEVTAAGELNTFAGLIKDAAQTQSNLVLDSETLEQMGCQDSGPDLATLGTAYVDNTRDLARGAQRFTDKMPLNFFYAGLIHRALPNARIVALRRDPMDSCLSNFRQLFSTGYSYYNYSLDLADTASYYLAFDQLMAHWREVLPTDRFTEIHYEQIVLEQARETRRLLEFCGLSWDEACLRFHENTAPVSTASSVQVRQPLYTGSIDRWKKYGDKLEALQSQLGVLV